MNRVRAERRRCPYHRPVTTSGDDGAELLPALRALRQAVAAPAFAVAGPQQGEHRRRRDRLAAELDELGARLRDRDAPLLAVLAGGTGAGKSTIANTLVGHEVAATGVVRPTTSTPTLLAAPVDRDWFLGDRVLPRLARSEPQSPHRLGRDAGRVLHLVTTHAIPPGVAILDAPDVDSVLTEHRDLAEELLDAADVWVWHATARTYADEEGMRYLRRAARRRTALAVVLTQVHDRDVDEVRDDLARKLAAEGLGGTELLVVGFATPAGGRLPERTVADLRAWLFGLARPELRDAVRRRTIDGALDDLPHQAAPLLDALADDAQVSAELTAIAAQAYRRVPGDFAAALDEGLPLRREVLARWRDVVGTNRFAGMIETATGLLRSWLRDALSTVASAEERRVESEVRAEVADTVADLAVTAHDLAAADVAAAWDARPAGRALLAADPRLRASEADLRERVDEAIAGWQDTVVDLVATRGADRRVRARWVSTLVNAGATAAILLAFASTGGLTGVEAGLAAGASAANQALLTKLLGAQNLSWLLKRVREDLAERSTALASGEAERYLAAVAEVAPDPAEAAAIRAALDAVARARR